MKIPHRPHHALLLGLGLFCAAGAVADGPADNQPAKVRPVPPPGIEVPLEERQRLDKGLSELGRALDELEADPKRAGLAADVRIYYNAARYALHYGEFFKPEEIVAAQQQLATGLARARQAEKGQATWRDATGPSARGYLSRIDGSVQPYGLFVPESFRSGGPGKWRLDVWFHGRGETLSEVNFIRGVERGGGPFVAPDTFVLQPYGRYCNANKFAGEIDLLEAIEDVQRHYRIDPDRIIIRGFSMGGAACWQFAGHYADRWAAAAPGAGFSETPLFLQVFQNETVRPQWWERLLWQWYDMPVYAPNFLNLPVVAYSGEIDRQKQAADVMESALARERIRLVHIIGPATGHSYHPAAAAEISARIDRIAAVGRDPLPRRLRFRTPTLRYNRHHWVTIDALEEHWKPGEVEGEITGPGSVVIRTSGIQALSLEIPPGLAPFAVDRAPVIEVDAETLTGPAVWSDRSWRCSLTRESGRWVVAAAPAEGLRKRHGLQGPIDDAFMQPFLIVRPSKLPSEPAVARWVEAEMKRAIAEWRRQFRGEPRVKRDDEVTEDDIQRYNLALWGTPESNSLVSRVAHSLPIGWRGDQIEAGDRRFAAATHVPLAIYPNPLNRGRYIVLNSGFTFREYDYLNNARQVARLPDWAIVDVTVPPDSRSPGKIVDADFFGEQWQIQKPAAERGVE